VQFAKISRLQERKWPIGSVIPDRPEVTPLVKGRSSVQTTGRSATRQCKFRANQIEGPRLSGKARTEFERSQRNLAKSKGAGSFLLDLLTEIFHYANGKADAWPSVVTLAEGCGKTRRTIQQGLRQLEAWELIRCMQDESLPTHRRIVLGNHPGYARVCAVMRVLPWVSPESKPVPKPALPVHQGAQFPVHQGAQFPVHQGAQSGAPKLPPISNSGSFNSVFSPRRNPQTTQPRRLGAILGKAYGRAYLEALAEGGNP